MSDMAANYSSMSVDALWEKMNQRYGDALELVKNKDRLREAAQTDDGLISEYFWKSSCVSD